MQRRAVMHRLAVFAALAIVAGCKQDLLDDLPDASTDIDAMDVPIPAGDFSCIGTDYPATAPDPLSIRGGVKVGNDPMGGIPVEIRRSTDDTLLAQDTSDANLGDRAGRYSQSVATGGVAPRIYRKVVGANDRLDAYDYDGIPVSVGYDLWTNTFTESWTNGWFTAAGVPRDLMKGMMFLRVFDCSIPPSPSRAVAGVVVEAPAGATVIYVQADGLVNPALTQTTADGGFFVLNVTPGFVNLKLRAGPFEYRDWPVRVHANSWTNGVRHP